MNSIIINDKKVSICVIIAYFGRLPSTFDVWLKSCEWNRNIDFLICSDNKPVDKLASNILWEQMSFENFQKLVEHKLSFPVKLDSPYDCCDFKAVYGIIFEDIVGAYDYWGYCDMDMVFGDLELYFQKYRITEYDRFLYLGHLSLMRNSAENNNRYKLPCTPGKGYRDAFSVSGTTQFCEYEINQIFKMYNFPFFDDKIFADIRVPHNRMKLADDNRKNYDYQTFFWQDGKVWRAFYSLGNVYVEEFAYIHFQKRKMNRPSFDVKKTKMFYIVSDGYVEKEKIGYPSLREIKKLNPFRGRLWEELELVYDRVRNGIKRRMH